MHLNNDADISVHCLKLYFAETATSLLNNFIMLYNNKTILYTIQKFGVGKKKIVRSFFFLL